jgi:hypothetical protein
VTPVIHYSHMQFPQGEKAALLMAYPAKMRVTKTITLQLPGLNQYQSQSYYLVDPDAFGYVEFFLDGKSIATRNSGLILGPIAADQFYPDTQHILAVTNSDWSNRGYLGFAIVYSGQAPLSITGADLVSTLTLEAPPAALLVASSDALTFSYLPTIRR